jgi:hypothetical protein
MTPQSNEFACLGVVVSDPLMKDFGQSPDTAVFFVMLVFILQVSEDAL